MHHGAGGCRGIGTPVRRDRARNDVGWKIGGRVVVYVDARYALRSIAGDGRSDNRQTSLFLTADDCPPPAICLVVGNQRLVDKRGPPPARVHAAGSAAGRAAISTIAADFAIAHIEAAARVDAAGSRIKRGRSRDGPVVDDV